MDTATHNHVSIPTDIAEKAWFRHAMTVQLYLYLCLKACQKDEEVKNGVKLRKGQVLTSTRQLAECLGDSKSSIHRSLGSLRDSNDISVTDMKKMGILITICKWDSSLGQLKHDITNDIIGTYNDEKMKAGTIPWDSPGTVPWDSQELYLQTGNQQITNHNKENVGQYHGTVTKEKEKFPPHPPYKEKENFGGGNIAHVHAREGEREKKIFEKMKANEIWQNEGPCRILKIPLSECKKWIEEFEADNIARMKNEHWTLKRACEHFINWAQNRKRIENEQSIRREQMQKRAEGSTLTRQERHRMELGKYDQSVKSHIQAMLLRSKEKGR